MTKTIVNIFLCLLPTRYHATSTTTATYTSSLQQIYCRNHGNSTSTIPDVVTVADSAAAHTFCMLSRKSWQRKSLPRHRWS